VLPIQPKTSRGVARQSGLSAEHDVMQAAAATRLTVPRRKR